MGFCTWNAVSYFEIEKSLLMNYLINRYHDMRMNSFFIIYVQVDFSLGYKKNQEEWQCKNIFTFISNVFARLHGRMAMQ